MLLKSHSRGQVGRKESLVYFGCQHPVGVGVRSRDAWGACPEADSPPDNQWARGFRAFIGRVGLPAETAVISDRHLEVGHWSDQRHLVISTVSLQFQSQFVSIS